METNGNNHISAQQAAEMLGKTKRRINQLVVDGELTAQRIGNMNVIERASVERYQTRKAIAATYRSNQQ